MILNLWLEFLKQVRDLVLRLILELMMLNLR